MKKAFTLIELLIVVAIIAILAAIAVPNFLEAQTRSKVSRVKSDMRSVAVAVESYMVDNNTLPAFGRTNAGGALATTGSNGILLASPANAMAAAVAPGKTTELTALDKTPSFALRGSTMLSTITSPIAYMTAYPTDPFKDTKGATFAYASGLSGTWLMYSCGPDTDQSASYGCGQLGVGSPAFSESVVNPSAWGTGLYATVGTILATGAGTGGSYTYDPTNGTTSKGDVWRSNQFNN